ncbi:hypothetical protein Plhal304r1_c041g0120301 [Plasmopara halstedii]
MPASQPKQPLPLDLVSIRLLLRLLSRILLLLEHSTSIASLSAAQFARVMHILDARVPLEALLATSLPQHRELYDMMLTGFQSALRDASAQFRLSKLGYQICSY